MMDLVSSCKEKLQSFRIKELKDVLTQLGFSKQGRKQDLVGRILGFLVDDQASKLWTKRPTLTKEVVARLVDDIHRKVQGYGAIDLASKAQCTSNGAIATSTVTATPAPSPNATVVSTATSTSPAVITLKPKLEIEDSVSLNMKVRCPCGSSLLTESMIKCEDPRCQVWQHISCVIIPEKPMDGIPAVPSQFYCEICRLNRADPFWSTLGHPLYPVKLIASNMPTDGMNPMQCMDKTFQLTRSERELLSKPEYAVQAWCMLLNDKVSFRMQWPQYAELQVNGMPVKAISRPGSQLLGANGRDDGPNISQYTKDGINTIFLSGCDSRIFCLGVRIVKRRSLQQILSMIPKESDGELFEDALARVRRCIGGGAAENADDSDSDLEVVADSITVNLRCPMSGLRMKTAGRFHSCGHMGCFDLETFVAMQQRSRKWQCPICLKNYSLENLIIDPYFNRIAIMMHSCGEDATEIEVKPDGSWRVKSDSECRDLKQWRMADGSLYLPDGGEIKNQPETSMPTKQEGTSLKLGIRKNSNGVWEVSKHGDTNTLSSSDRVPEKLVNGVTQVIPMSSSATFSGRDGEDPSFDQDANGHYDLFVTSGAEYESLSLNLDPTFVLTNQNTLAAAKDSEFIVLSDSDDENVTMGNCVVDSNGMLDNGVNYSVDPHGITGPFQEDPDLGIAGSSCLDLFNPDDEFSLPLWPQLSSSTQGASSFQLFGSNGDGSDTFTNPHITSVNCPMSMNGYMLAPNATMDPASLLLDPCVGLSNNDLNDGLVDNPLAFGREDPLLQIFLPTKPSDACGPTDARNHHDIGNGLSGEDWISLRLGDAGGTDHGNTVSLNDSRTGKQPESREGAMDSLADTASFLLGSNGSKSEKIRERSDSPFSLPRSKRSKQRLDFSIDSDSE